MIECLHCGHPKHRHSKKLGICRDCKPTDSCPRYSPHDPARPFRTSCASCGEILHNVDGHSQGPICPHCGGVTYA